MYRPTFQTDSFYTPPGDFDIPSSREDVDRDSSWNQWLRSEIPQLLLHALGVFTVRGVAGGGGGGGGKKKKKKPREGG